MIPLHTFRGPAADAGLPCAQQAEVCALDSSAVPAPGSSAAMAGVKPTDRGAHSLNTHGWGIAPPMATTHDAIAYGLSISPLGICALRVQIAETRAAHAMAMQQFISNGHSEADLNRLMDLGYRAQLLREAMEAATRSGSVGQELARRAAAARRP